MTAASATFGDLLRRHRLAAGLTQEELAARAQVSPRAISDLERGLHLRPWRETVQLLATALQLEGSPRGELERAAQHGNRPAGEPSRRAAPVEPSGDHADKPVPRHNLPVPLTSLVGRASEIGEIDERLRSARLLTLIGTGGVGKTRLALAVAERLVPDYPDGVWLAEIAALSDPPLVPFAIASAVGLQVEPGQPVEQTLLAALRSRQLLLVLDN